MGKSNFVRLFSGNFLENIYVHRTSRKAEQFFEKKNLIASKHSAIMALALCLHAKIRKKILDMAGIIL